MRICIICPVRKGTPDEVYAHVAALEGSGHKVFFPTRDIPQRMPESEICRKMRKEIAGSNEVHVWYSSDSQGVHYDIGVLETILDWSVFAPSVKWLNPIENPVGYESVLAGMVGE